LLQQQIPTPLLDLGLTYEKDAFAFTSSPFDLVATGLRTIQFLLFDQIVIFICRASYIFETTNLNNLLGQGSQMCFEDLHFFTRQAGPEILLGQDNTFCMPKSLLNCCKKIQFDKSIEFVKKKFTPNKSRWAGPGFLLCQKETF
jgi:hypothetical protein